MKNSRVILVISLSTAFGLALAIAFGWYRIRSQECRAAQDRCIRDCDRVRDDGLAGTNGQRGIFTIRFGQDMTQCIVQHVGDPAATEQCREETRRALRDEMARLDALDEAFRETHRLCVGRCRQEGYECDNTPATATPLVSAQRPFEFECPPGGAPCFKEVLEVCTVISGPCDDCWRSLCGGGQWAFESETPVAITVVAATDPLKNPRVIATSSMNGNQAVLNVPTDIKLSSEERLYLGVSPKEKSVGPFKLLIRRRG
jgi:hypothetical protein